MSAVEHNGSKFMSAGVTTWQYSCNQCYSIILFLLYVHRQKPTKICVDNVLQHGRYC